MYWYNIYQYNIYQLNVRSVTRIVPKQPLYHYSLLIWLTVAKFVQQAVIGSFLCTAAVQETVP